MMLMVRSSPVLNTTCVLLALCATLGWGSEQHSSLHRLRRTTGTATAVGTVTKLRLINADTNLPIAAYDPLPTVSRIDLDTLPTPNLSIEALTSSGDGTTVESVAWVFDSVARTENTAPWAMCFNNGADIFACKRLVAGFNSTIAVTPFSRREGRGIRGTSVSIQLSLFRGGVGTPTKAPAAPPVTIPTKAPVTGPTKAPAAAPTKAPVVAPKAPENVPTKAPIVASTKSPMKAPTKAPAKAPVAAPTKGPVAVPTKAPVAAPTKAPFAAPTKAPFAAPTKAPESAPMKAPPTTPSACSITITQYINSMTLSNRTLSWNGTTPEDKALGALVLFDQNQTLGLSPCVTGQAFRLLQKYALLTLYYQQVWPFTYRGKPAIGAFSALWGISTNWSGIVNDECTWFGIACSPATIKGGGDDNVDIVQNAVTGIRMPNNWLRGTLPADLGLLTLMQDFDIAENTFLSGPFPSSLSRWTNLKSYNSVGVLFRGDPTLIQLGAWTKLEYVNASLNGIIPGSIPSYFGEWTKIKHAHFGSYGFVGTLPTLLARWTDIEFFSVGMGNLVNGTIPSELTSAWSKVKTVVLKSHRLSGSVPSTLAQWKQLETLDLSYNILTGSIPTELCMFPTRPTITVDCTEVQCSCCNCSIVW